MERLLHEPEKRKETPAPTGRYTSVTENAPMAEGLAELLEADKASKGAEREHTRGQLKAIEKQEVAAIVAEEAIDTDPAVDTDSEVGTLTGQPHADDQFQYAMLVCAPWTSLSSFKYKVKVVPGSAAGKKSRVAHEALSVFTKQAEGTDRELELVKALSVDEAVHLLPQASRLVLPGMNKKNKAGAKHKKGKRRGGQKRSERRGKK